MKDLINTRAALAVTIGRAFRTLLETELTTPVLHEIINLNRGEADRNICHSHDYCDANMVMNEAMERVLGREAVMTWDVEGGQCTADQHEADMWLFNNSWQYANLR